MSTLIFRLIRANQPEIERNYGNNMIKKEISGANQPEKKDASGCVAQGGADQPEAARFLGARIREIREKTGLGRRTVAAEKLGFNHNTIASYETALSLPDIDFLVVFADKTGADLNELVRLRLAASRYPEARALSGFARMQTEPEPPPAKVERKLWPESFEDIDRKLVINHRTDEKPFTEQELAERPDLAEVRDRLYEIAGSPAYTPQQQCWANMRLGRHFGDTVAFAKGAEYQREHVAESMRWASRLLAKEAERVGYNPPPAWSGLLHELLLFGMLTDTGCRTILEHLRDQEPESSVN